MTERLRIRRPRRRLSSSTSTTRPRADIDAILRRLEDSARSLGHDGELDSKAVQRAKLPGVREQIRAEGGRVVQTTPIPGTDSVAVVWSPADPGTDIFLSPGARQLAAKIAVRSGDASGVEIPPSVRALAEGRA